MNLHLLSQHIQQPLNPPPTQLAASGAVAPVFSLCFGFPSGGALLLGDAPPPQSVKLSFTPLVPSKTPYYAVTLEALELAGAPLRVDAAAFAVGYGAVFDSGTTFSYLPTAAFAALLAALEAALAAAARGEGPGGAGAAAAAKALRRAPGPDPAYPDVCWRGAPDAFRGLEAVFPAARLKFAGGAALALPPHRYLFLVGPPGTYCLGVFDNGAAGTIIGGIAARGALVRYEPAAGRLGFGDADCRAIGAAAAAAPTAAAGAAGTAAAGAAGAKPKPPPASPHKPSSGSGSSSSSGGSGGSGGGGSQKQTPGAKVPASSAPTPPAAKPPAAKPPSAASPTPPAKPPAAPARPASSGSSGGAGGAAAKPKPAPIEGHSEEDGDEDEEKDGNGGQQEQQQQQQQQPAQKQTPPSPQKQQQQQQPKATERPSPSPVPTRADDGGEEEEEGEEPEADAEDDDDEVAAALDGDGALATPRKTAARSAVLPPQPVTAARGWAAPAAVAAAVAVAGFAGFAAWRGGGLPLPLLPRGGQARFSRLPTSAPAGNEWDQELAPLRRGGGGDGDGEGGRATERQLPVSVGAQSGAAAAPGW